MGVSITPLAARLRDFCRCIQALVQTGVLICGTFNHIKPPGSGMFWRGWVSVKTPCMTTHSNFSKISKNKNLVTSPNPPCEYRDTPPLSMPISALRLYKHLHWEFLAMPLPPGDCKIQENHWEAIVPPWTPLGELTTVSPIPTCWCGWG